MRSTLVLSLLVLLLASSCGGGPADPLTRAAAAGRTEEVASLVRGGADPNLHDPAGHTPLCVAARFGQLETMKVLLEHGALPDLPDERHGWTPLMTAIHRGENAAASLLLDHGARPDVLSGGLTALVMAAGYGNTEVVRELLARGADPRKRAGGRSALGAAVGGVPDVDRFTVGECQTETVRALLEREPSLRLGDGLHERMALRIARWARCEEVLSMVERGSRATETPLQAVGGAVVP